jgi:hypothetical protein
LSVATTMPSDTSRCATPRICAHTVMHTYTHRIQNSILEVRLRKR